MDIPFNPLPTDWPRENEKRRGCATTTAFLARDACRLATTALALPEARKAKWESSRVDRGLFRLANDNVFHDRDWHLAASATRRSWEKNERCIGRRTDL